MGRIILSAAKVLKNIVNVVFSHLYFVVLFFFSFPGLLTAIYLSRVNGFMLEQREEIRIL